MVFRFKEYNLLYLFWHCWCQHFDCDKLRYCKFYIIYYFIIAVIKLHFWHIFEMHILMSILKAAIILMSILKGAIFTCCQVLMLLLALKGWINYLTRYICLVQMYLCWYCHRTFWTPWNNHCNMSIYGMSIKQYNLWANTPVMFSYEPQVIVNSVTLYHFN